MWAVGANFQRVVEIVMTGCHFVNKIGQYDDTTIGKASSVAHLQYGPHHQFHKLGEADQVQVSTVIASHNQFG